MAKPVTVHTTEHTTSGATNSVTAQTNGEIVIQRTTYSLAGQAIAVRVTGDPNPANNGLFYLHSDHLGSTSAMSDVNGNLVPDSTARYTPFGDWRTEPGTNPTITDRGYTGHAHNNSGANDLGLIYMNARYYVPNTNRFLSADTIVPDYSDPQSLNRYTYVLNSPLNFIDPSGHNKCGVGQYQCENDIDRFALMKSQYQYGDDLVFGPAGSSGVQRYVEIGINYNAVSLVIPFNINGLLDTELDTDGIGLETGIGLIFGLGGEAILEASFADYNVDSFKDFSLGDILQPINGQFEGGKGMSFSIGGLEFGGKKITTVNTDGTESVEASIGAIFADGAGGVTYDPNSLIIRPSEKLSIDLAKGERGDAWQTLWGALYGASSVVPSGYSFNGTVPADPLFPDYGGFLPITTIYKK